MARQANSINRQYTAEIPTGKIMIAAIARLLAASCSSLTCVVVLHSTDKSARRNSRPVSKRSHEKARKAAELTCVCYGMRVYTSAASGNSEHTKVGAHNWEDHETQHEQPR